MSQFFGSNAAEIVQVKQGKLSGIIRGSSFGSVYKAYLGIPFAAPPIGELRFKDPEPPACWEGIRYAKNMSFNMSAQLQKYSETAVIGSEDCLYLNVYVSCNLHEKNEQKAVMVWIHGGNFRYGNGNVEEIRPDYFMDKDIIIVSINYRLGVLGFLNLNHEEASGNQGLKDQIAALKWIKENIASFNGDPNNITVFGYGAGAVSAHLLTISPLSKDLIHKAILHSGVALCYWAIRQEQPEAFKLALLLGCDSKNPEEIVKFLRKCPYQTLVQMESNVVTDDERRIKRVIFGPTIDEGSQNSFLPTRTIIYQDNNIPMILGYTSHEYLKYFIDVTQECLDKIYADLPLYIEKLDSATMETYNYIFQMYNIGICKNREVMDPSIQYNEYKIQHLIQYMSAIQYCIPIKNVAHIRLKKRVATYLYFFDYNGKETESMMRPNQHLDGVSHGDDLAYLFYIILHHKVYNRATPATHSPDHTMIRVITAMWSNFAKSGEPSADYDNLHITWLPQDIQKDQIGHMSFNDVLQHIFTYRTYSQQKDIKLIVS